MLLAIDIGNTNIVWGLYDQAQLLGNWRVATDPRRTGDEYGVTLNSLLSFSGHSISEVDAAIVSSVVPPANPPVIEMCRRYLRTDPLLVGPDTYTGMEVRYDNPHEIGADRIVNAVAAYDKYGGPLIIVDFGTATTFDAVSADGAYLGGAIAPGIGISAEALFARASRLSRVPLVRPPQAIGRTTEASLQSGIVFGFAGQVDAMVRRIAAEMAGRPRVIATGGLAAMVSQETESVDQIDPLLTLEGLRLIYQRNLALGQRRT